MARDGWIGREAEKLKVERGRRVQIGGRIHFISKVKGRLAGK